MAKQNPPEPKLAVYRRQLLSATAAITVVGVLPTEPTETAIPAEAAITPAPIPVAHPPTLNVCAVTARRIEEIVARNRIRAEACLPLLSIPKELRRMKETADTAEFEAFANAHRGAVWDEVLATKRQGRGEPNWHPSGWM